MQKSCAVCGAAFESKRPAGKFCGDTCRKRAQRRPDLLLSPPPAVEDDAVGSPGPVEAATLAELGGAGQLAAAVGQAAVMLARRLDNSERETGAALASLSREYRATLEEAVRDAPQAADPLDELRLRRERKLDAG